MSARHIHGIEADQRRYGVLHEGQNRKERLVLSLRQTLIIGAAFAAGCLAMGWHGVLGL